MTEIGLPTLRVTAGKVVFTHLPVIAGLASAFEIRQKLACLLAGAMSRATVVTGLEKKQQNLE